MTIADKVKKVVADKLCVNESDVTPEAHFMDDLGADSLDLVVVIWALEKKFSISIPDEKAKALITVGQAIAYIEEIKN